MASLDGATPQAWQPIVLDPSVADLGEWEPSDDPQAWAATNTLIGRRRSRARSEPSGSAAGSSIA